MQEKSKARHRQTRGKVKPKGLYSSNDKQYVYGENTVRKSGKTTKVLFVLLPFVMIIIISLGFLLGYMDYREEEGNKENPVISNENYITVEQQKTLYKTVSMTDPLERSCVPDLVSVDGVEVNVLMENALTNLVNAAKQQGVPLTLKYGYISYDEQHNFYQSYVQSLLDTGKYTQVRAESVANRKVCDSGYSERQLGLLVEFDCNSGEDFEKSEQYVWLNKHAAEYGFMQRYSKSNEQSTAMDSNPSLWRYIGSNNALFARRLGLDFNELIDYLAN